MLDEMLPSSESFAVPVNVTFVSAGNEAPLAGAAISSVGAVFGAFTVTDWLAVSLPPGPLTVRVAVYVAGASYVVWTGSSNGRGSSTKPVPFPSVHVIDVMFPVDVSVNCTVRGAVPVVGTAVNDATGGGTLTVNVWLVV